MNMRVSLILIAGALLLLPASLQAFGEQGGGCGKDCKSCHSLSTKDVQEALQKVKAQYTKVVSIKESSAKGLWEVTVDNKGQSGVFYIDFGKKHLIVGQIIEIDTGSNKTSERLKKLEENKRVDVSKIPLDGALVMGNAKAKIKVIVFTDPDCPFCAKLHAELKKVIEQRNDVAFYIKFYPLPSHKDAYWKSKSIVCGKSLSLLEDNFSGKQIPKNECAEKEIDNNLKLVETLGIGGTPTLVLPKGRVRSGFLTADEIIKLIGKG
jgi:thiol:disulfide interchange protein DsbC